MKRYAFAAVVVVASACTLSTAGLPGSGFSDTGGSPLATVSSSSGILLTATSSSSSSSSGVSATGGASSASSASSTVGSSSSSASSSASSSSSSSSSASSSASSTSSSSGIVGWDETGYGYRVQITFDNGSGTEDVSSFPVPLALTTNGNGVDFTKIQPAGQDIRFTDSAGNNLPYEIESWNGGAGTALVWVLVPSIHKASTSDYVWLYYGNASAPDGQNATGVWQSYVGVYHLADDTSTSSTVKDSTGKGGGTWNGGTGGKGNPGPTSGEFAGALQFADNAYVDLSNTAAFQVAAGNAVTAEAWFQVTAEASGGNNAYVLYEENDCEGWSFGVWDDGGGNKGAANGSFGLTSASGACGTDFAYTSVSSSGTNYGTSGWHYETLVVDRNAKTVTIYVDGVSKQTNDITTSNTNATSNIVRIGTNYDYMASFTGIIDEARVSGTARSPGWIATQFKAASPAFTTLAAVQHM